MQVKDIMQTDVAVVRPDSEIAAAAKIMAKRRVSGLPVVDTSGAVVGMLTEGDFLHRSELGRASSRSWWLDLVGAGETASEFVRAHAKYVKDAMRTDVKTIAPNASLADAAMALETHGIKRLPVVEDKRLLGIVSRADLVRALASLAPETPQVSMSDADVREAVQQAISGESRTSGVQVTVIVRDGVVELWGLAASQQEIDAARVVAERTPGVRSVVVKITQFPTAYYG